MNYAAKQLAASKELALGQPLQAVVGPDRLPLVGSPETAARRAAANTLAAFLGQLLFRTACTEEAPEGVQFRLNEVRPVWPNPKTELPYPCASIIEEDAQYEWHSLEPTALEDTRDLHAPDSVLWKTAELVVDFQVDFWTNTEPHRDAIEALLPQAFSPTEGRAGVLLRGDEKYFYAPVRATLEGTFARPDESDTVFERERRLRVTVRVEMDVIHLREANDLQVSTPEVMDME